MTLVTRMFMIVSAVLLSATGYTSYADVARGLLHADGILTVNGGNVADATVTITPAHAPSYKLSKVKQFTLELELNSSYMVTFEHPDCLTKQLYFETKVPVDYQLDEYHFPFEVVLEVERDNERQAYVGPVGYIRYMDLVNDFDYETDYTLKIDERIKERMETERTVGSNPTALKTATERTPAVGTSTVLPTEGVGNSDPAVIRVGPNSGNPAPKLPAQEVTAAETPEPARMENDAANAGEPVPAEVPIETEQSLEITEAVDVAEEVEEEITVPVEELPSNTEDKRVHGAEEIKPVLTDAIGVEEEPVEVAEDEVEQEAGVDELIIPAEEVVVVEEEIVPVPMLTIAVEPELAPELTPTPLPARIVHVPVRLEPLLETPETPARAPRPVVTKAPARTVLPSHTGITSDKYSMPDPKKEGRVEELIVEDTKVTTIVRIVNHMGYAHEYRRIAHKFGPVYYFKDDHSITESMYSEDTGMPVE